MLEIRPLQNVPSAPLKTCNQCSVTHRTPDGVTPVTLIIKEGKTPPPTTSRITESVTIPPNARASHETTDGLPGCQPNLTCSSLFVEQDITHKLISMIIITICYLEPTTQQAQWCMQSLYTPSNWNLATSP